jgi:hypothetical protein
MLWAVGFEALFDFEELFLAPDDEERGLPEAVLGAVLEVFLDVLFLVDVVDFGCPTATPAESAPAIRQLGSKNLKNNLQTFKLFLARGKTVSFQSKTSPTIRHWTIGG